MSKYTNEQKEKALELYASGVSVASVVKECKIPRSTVYGWISAENLNGNDELAFTPKNFRMLKTKADKLEQIVAVLKSSDCTLNAPLHEKLKVIKKLYGQYSVHILCEAFSVSRGTFYNYLLRNKNENTTYAKRREVFSKLVKDVHDEFNQILGAKKITAVLNELGHRTTEKYVRSIMQDMGLASIRQGAKAFYHKEQSKAKNHLNQNFKVDTPNEVWVSDVSFFHLHKHTYYICVIIDLFARKVVSHKVSHKNSTQLTKSTFKQAYLTRKPKDGLIFHTDQGSNYRSFTFMSYLKELGVTQSFSRAHIPYDNSVAEAFFSSLKQEDLYRHKFKTEKDFRKAVDEYIVFYNTKRPHTYNKNKTPVKVEDEFYSNNEKNSQ
ncbi:MAG: IS3 family transposase [Clostridiales bacterium]|jgi:transposase InsO family protein|nr:IS3 family transposase [Clostridiales bacterium]